MKLSFSLTFKEKTLRKLRQATSRGISAVSRAIQQQPDYCSEVSDDYVAALQNHVDKNKPANFKLTPISEPGW